jgi:hypothetical protein
MIGTLTITALLGTLAITTQPALADATSLPPVAFADQDDDENKDEEEGDLDYGGDIDLDVFEESLDMTEGDDALERMKAEDDLEAQDASEEQLDDLDFGTDEDEEWDFDDDDEEVQIGGPGQDTARIYREFGDSIEDLGPDEEVIQWEQYLRKYPNSLFQDHIQRRIDELTEFQYSQRVPDDLDGSFGDIVDAGRREIKLATPRHLSSIDPRNKMRAGFEWGFPSYMNLFADYEAQIQRKWSWHVGIINRYTGWNIEAGTKYALVKSARTNMLVTGIFDFHLNSNPLFPAVRPQVGVGKRFLIAGLPLDLQAVGGVDVELRIDAPLDLKAIGGLNATFAASDRVAFFVESSIVAKDFFWDAGINSGFFRFPLLTFGITFWTGKGDNITSSIAANAPYAYSYWGYHFGGVMGDFNFYRD